MFQSKIYRHSELILCKMNLLMFAFGSVIALANASENCLDERAEIAELMEKLHNRDRLLYYSGLIAMIEYIENSFITALFTPDRDLLVKIDSEEDRHKEIRRQKWLRILEKKHVSSYACLMLRNRLYHENIEREVFARNMGEIYYLLSTIRDKHLLTGGIESKEIEDTISNDFILNRCLLIFKQWYAVRGAGVNNPRADFHDKLHYGRYSVLGAI